MKNGEVIELYETLNNLCNDSTLKLSVPVGYIFAKNKERLRQEAVVIYNERRKIIMEHGILEGKDIIVPNEYIDDVNKKIDQLMDLENDVQIQQIPIDLLEHYEFGIKDIEGLMPIIQPFEFTKPPIINFEKKTDE